MNRLVELAESWTGGVSGSEQVTDITNSGHCLVITVTTPTTVTIRARRTALHTITTIKCVHTRYNVTPAVHNIWTLVSDCASRLVSLPSTYLSLLWYIVTFVKYLIYIYWDFFRKNAKMWRIYWSYKNTDQDLQATYLSWYSQCQWHFCHTTEHTADALDVGRCPETSSCYHGQALLKGQINHMLTS